MWCYNTIQAMVHELIGIEDNKVDLKSIGKIAKDQEVGYISYTGNYVIVYCSIDFVIIKRNFLLFLVTGGCVIIRTRSLFQS